VVTAGAWDVPPAWTDQLAPDGRLVVPLRWRGQTQCVGFARGPGGELVADGMCLCGFIPLVGADGEREHELQTGLLVVDEDQDVDPAGLADALDSRPVERWTGVLIGGRDPYYGVGLRLTAAEPGAAWLISDRFVPRRTAALVDDGSLAVFGYRRFGAGRHGPGGELGAIGFGPAGRSLADRIGELIRAWDADRYALPDLTAFPAGTPDDRLPSGLVIDKRHRRLVIDFPGS
jgi:protein-L-isoaspartate(D-aspartate) O-methyltransferase